MRWYILRTLIDKEVRRHLANRGGLVLILLLIVAALLLSFVRQDEGGGPSLVGGVQRCYVEYWEDDGFIAHLRQERPRELATQLTFRQVANAPRSPDGTILYEQSSGAIQVRPAE